MQMGHGRTEPNGNRTGRRRTDGNKWKTEEEDGRKKERKRDVDKESIPPSFIPGLGGSKKNKKKGYFSSFSPSLLLFRYLLFKVSLSPPLCPFMISWQFSSRFVFGNPTHLSKFCQINFFSS